MSQVFKLIGINGSSTLNISSYRDYDGDILVRVDDDYGPTVSMYLTPTDQEQLYEHLKELVKGE